LNLFFKFDSHHSILFFISNFIFFIVIYFVLNFVLICFFNSISHYLVDWKFNLVIFLGCLFMGWPKPYELGHEFVKLDWVDFGLFFLSFSKINLFRLHPSIFYRFGIGLRDICFSIFFLWGWLKSLFFHFFFIFLVLSFNIKLVW
jgi:hypothetical protein